MNIKKLEQNFLKKYAEQENKLQQTCLNFLNTIDKLDTENIKKYKIKLNDIINKSNYYIEKFKQDCKNTIYQQILIPVFKNKFFLLTDFALVDHCLYISENFFRNKLQLKIILSLH